MVQVVEVIAGDGPVAEGEAFKSKVAHDRGYPKMLGVEEEVYRVGGDDKVDQHTAEVEQVLYRVHRQTGPGPRVGVQVMDAVHVLEQRPPMEQAVGKVEVHLADKENEEEEADIPGRVVAEAKVGHAPIGRRPRVQYFVRGPDGQTEHERAEQIIQRLLAEQELAPGLFLKAGVVLTFFASQPVCVIRQMCSPIDNQHDHQVAQQHEPDPTWRQRLAVGEGYLKISHRQKSKQHNQDVKRPQQAWKAKDPA